MLGSTEVFIYDVKSEFVVSLKSTGAGGPTKHKQYFVCLSGNPLKSDWGSSNYFPLFGVLTFAAVLSPSVFAPFPPPLILDPRCGRAIPLRLLKVPLFFPSVTGKAVEQDPDKHGDGI